MAFAILHRCSQPLTLHRQNLIGIGQVSQVPGKLIAMDWI